MEWMGPESPSLVQAGAFDELQLKDNKSASALTVFFGVKCVESAIWYIFSYMHISLFLLL